MKSKLKVGVFDSGIGGLTVLSACVKRAPEASYYYYGDNANAPYGGKSRAEITRLVRRALEEFAKEKVSAVVLACNTATAVCAEEMRARFPFPVVGIEPAVKPAAERCKNALVLATPRTSESERLHALIARSKECKFTVYPSARLAGAIEKKFLYGEPLTLSDHLPNGIFDGVVLGCTHYAFLKEEISAFYGGIPVFDGGAGTANRLADVLSAQNVGIADHQNPRISENERAKNREAEVHFVGKSRKLNENLYNSEHTF